MKKKLVIALCLVMSLTMLLCSCGETANSATGSQGSLSAGNVATENQTAKLYTLAKAKELLLNSIEAQTLEEVSQYLAADSQDHGQNMLTTYPDGMPIVKLELAVQLGNYDVYSFEISYADKDFHQVGAALLERNESGYKLSFNTEACTALADRYGCKQCNRTGQMTVTNRQACAICSGTGVWYNAMAYFDAALNMWMGQNQACGGCAGSGYTNVDSTAICSACNGACVVFH